MSLLNSQLHQQTTVSSLLTTTSSISLSKTHHKTLTFLFRKPTISSLQFSLHHHPQQQLYNNVNRDDEGYEEEQVIGDCLVFEEGIFEDPFIQNEVELEVPKQSKKFNNNKTKIEVKPEDLIPANWKDVQAEINITKKERRKMAQEMEFGSKLQRKKQGLRPIPMGYESAKEYKAAKLRELKPVVLDNPELLEENDEDEIEIDEGEGSRGIRVAPRNPKMAVYGRSLDDISRFLNSGMYDPDAAKDPQGSRKLFTKEEKFLMNRRVPDLAAATSDKWQPLHTLAASGEFYLLDTLLKYSVDINVSNQEGLTAIHKAILGKKHAICNYLLRNSGNPFVRDKDGWTPLHLAVQSRRTDVVRLLLIKKADKSLKNQDGLTPLDLCLYSGRDTRTYEMIRLLKQPPKPRKYAELMG
ncbi:ankyrin repeat domain-containing protein, chloroplastic isoform X2 [Cynara cardunculus var. scolymus]|uniref:ankyrin repeat domain-containing protein, chloroplastic isoform X2 n=1 Tax=Cynara cardunculus var. scolymus TaxID=59895 RepID=UPI000D62CA5D|nr:ankyrin repeat domain-containing protein, chloroplastic isoform X2 [Cynara cardunculus var. scolymus]